MPAYNAGKYISESIESVINQTYKNWELMVVNDGSTDNIAAIVADYKRADPRIKYLFQPNGKQGKARNLGINNSSGKYIAFLDADDKWTPDKLTVQMQLITANEDIDMIFSQGYCINGNQIENYDVAIKELWKLDNFHDFIHHNQVPIVSVLTKKEVLEQVGNFTELEQIQNTEDYHLWLKLLANGNRFRSVANRLFYYRMHTGQATFQNKNLEWSTFNMYKDIFHLYPSTLIRKLIINKLRWLIFNADFHKECIDLIMAYFNDQGKSVWGFVIGHLRGSNIFSKKIAFKIVTVFG